jgi:integrase
MTHSLKFNESRKVWIAQVKKRDGKWTTKYLPREFLRQHKGDAERWLITWMAGFQLHEVKETKPTSLAPMTIAWKAKAWLQHRDNDKFTAHNTFNGFKLSMQNWILDNPKFSHHSIQNLEVTQELTVTELKAWVDSLQGANSTKIQHMNCLRSFFNDCIMLEWFDKDMANPLDKPAIKKLFKELQRVEREEKIITHLTPEQITDLLTKEHQFIPDYRKVWYLLAVSTGLRLEEIQGLTWNDIDFSKRTIDCQRQLVKPGIAPFLNYNELRKTMSKQEIWKLPNAVTKAPKRNSKRLIPCHPLLLETLRFWFSKGWKTACGRSPAKNDPLFGRQNTSLKEGQTAGLFRLVVHAGESLRTDLERLSLPTSYQGQDLVFHSLRHSFSHLCELAGAEDSKIKVLLGHAKGSTLRSNYLGTQLEVFRQIIESLKLPASLTLRDRVIGQSLPKLTLVKRSETA